jgi:hypothetical protein
MKGCRTAEFIVVKELVFLSMRFVIHLSTVAVVSLSVMIYGTESQLDPVSINAVPKTL